jgi:hypothetical protein
LAVGGGGLGVFVGFGALDEVMVAGVMLLGVAGVPLLGAFVVLPLLADVMLVAVAAVPPLGAFVVPLVVFPHANVGRVNRARMTVRIILRGVIFAPSMGTVGYAWFLVCCLGIPYQSLPVLVLGVV